MAHRVVEPRSLGVALRRWVSTYGDCVVNYEMAAKVCALTIDDAPSDPALMHRTLDILKENGVRATFFVVEEFARDPERRETLERAVREGHELANHLVKDESPASYSEDEFREALAACDALLQDLVDDWADRSLRWYRPPHGYMARYMKRSLRDLRYVAALADVFPLDTEVRSPDWIVDFVKQQTKPGSILLLHAPDEREAPNGRHHRRQNNLLVLQRLLPDLKAQGFTVTTLSDLDKASHLEHFSDPSRSDSSPLASPTISHPDLRHRPSLL
mmetsp:Transcript_17535/g.54779  ORF Transcript_17535/g.54779 Transcript_17535/m.54779 type:complete len:273 (+) Transcript_17535:496-1314(+)